MRFFRSIPVRLITVAILIMSLGALSFSAVAAQEGDTAKVRVIHASPDAPNVDVYVNGEAAVTDLAFQEATDYLDLPGGDYQIQVTATGSSPDEAVIDATVTIENGVWYSIAAIGQLESIAPLVLQDNITEPASGMAHLRVVHASPDAPNVDVAVTGGPVLIEDLPFGEATDYLPVDAGSYDLEVRPAGTEDVALAIPGFMAEAGNVYTVVAVGLAGDGSLTVLPLVDTTFDQTGDDTGTGGGDVPSMPETGVGGAAGTASDTTNWTLLAGIGAFALAVVAGGGALFSRKTRA